MFLLKYIKYIKNANNVATNDFFLSFFLIELKKYDQMILEFCNLFHLEFKKSETNQNQSKAT
jgi:hypothetical protein